MEWIELKSNKDLPKECGYYFVFTINKNIDVIYSDGDISNTQHTALHWLRNFTHLMEIKTPEIPK